jgi:hypothetical protein
VRCWFEKKLSVLAPCGFALIVQLAACEPRPPLGTGGVEVEESFGASGRSCGRGLVVVMTDESYASANVALVGLDGSTLSGSFISSASASPSLNAALSGDMVLPGQRMTGDIVLIDRFPNSVLSFVDVETAQVTQQISVRTGFDSNPQDFIEMGGGKALVSRLEKNRQPGREAFDGGDDLLVLDLNSKSIERRIDLSAYVPQAGDRVRPGAMVRRENHVFVALLGLNSNFQSAEEGGILVLDAETGEPLFRHSISDMKNCGGLSLSPDGARLAVSCSGLINEASAARPAYSGIVVYRLKSSADGEMTLTEEARLLADELGYGPFGPSLDYASDSLLWITTYGALEGADAGRPDRVISWSMNSQQAEVLAQSEKRPFNLGSVLCTAACGICFVADGERGILHRFAVVDDRVAEPTKHTVRSAAGLPPRLLGHF